MSRNICVSRRIFSVALIALLIALAAPFNSLCSVYSEYTDLSNIAGGARPMGMGNAYVASANDVNSIFFNPAGLAYAKRFQMTLGGSSVVNDNAYGSFALCFAGSNEGFGFGVIGGNSWAPLTNTPTREPILGKMITLELAEPERVIGSLAVLSYGVCLGKYSDIPVIKDTSVGISVKSFFQMIVATSDIAPGNGFDMDLGLIYKANNWLNIGLYGQDVLSLSNGGKFSWIMDDYQLDEVIPALYRAGFSAKLMGSDGLFNSGQDLYLNFEGEQSNYYKETPNIYRGGIEWWFLDNAALRVGLDQLLVHAATGEYDTESNYTAGLGWWFGDWGLDYAYHRYGENDLDTLQYFAVSYGFPNPTELPPQQPQTVEASLPAPATTEAAITVEVILASTEEFIILYSPSDKSIMVGDSIILSGEVISSKVAQLIINGNTINVSGESGKYLYAGLTIPMVGKFALSIKCFDASGLLLKEYKSRIIRLPSFSDVPKTYWARDKISLVSAIGLFGGYPDGTFKPNKTISRAELSSILIKASGYSSPEEVELEFKDVSSRNWAAYYIKTAVDLGMVSGYPDGTFRPAKTVTRAEGVSIISRFADLEIPDEIDAAPYEDMPMTHRAARTITAADNAGLLDYLRGKPFNPKKEMTRAEAAVVVSNTEFINGKLNQFLDWNSGF